MTNASLVRVLYVATFQNRHIIESRILAAATSSKLFPAAPFDIAHITPKAHLLWRPAPIHPDAIVMLLVSAIRLSSHNATPTWHCVTHDYLPYAPHRSVKWSRFFLGISYTVYFRQSELTHLLCLVDWHSLTYVALSHRHIYTRWRHADALSVYHHFQGGAFPETSFASTIGATPIYTLHHLAACRILSTKQLLPPWVLATAPFAFMAFCHLTLRRLADDCGISLLGTHFSHINVSETASCSTILASMFVERHVSFLLTLRHFVSWLWSGAT